MKKVQKKMEKCQPAKQPSRGPPLPSLSLPRAQPSTGPARPSLPSLTDAAAPPVSTDADDVIFPKSRPRQLTAAVILSPEIARHYGH